MILLAIDHGTRTGYSVFRDASLLKSGIIQLDSVTSLRQAYNEYYLLFSKAVPTHVVVEKVNVAGSKFGGNNIVKLAQLQAMILLLAQQFSCEVLEVNPMAMKKYITGNGRAEKHEVANNVAKTWNLEPKEICVPVYFKRKDGIKCYEADESDSIALGTYALNILCN